MVNVGTRSKDDACGYKVKDGACGYKMKQKETSRLVI